MMHLNFILGPRKNMGNMEDKEKLADMGDIGKMEDMGNKEDL